MPGREGSLGLTLHVRWACVGWEGAGWWAWLTLRGGEGPEVGGRGHAGPGRTWKVRLRSLGLTLPGVLGSWGEGSRQTQALVGFRL